MASNEKINIAHYVWLGCLLMAQAAWALFLLYWIWRLVLWTGRHFGFI